ncbi:GNAT family N-acetyltransferase [Lentzea sp. NPDC058436]|uniref:GNAT family N-acetyltransferase n=1 Tax=Lentzea sp. NPDC058436 TaxID=3346499 RepID=UPI003661C3B7
MTQKPPLLDLVRIRHLRQPDIPGRVAAMSEPKARENIGSLPALYNASEKTAFFTGLVEGQDPERVELVVTKRDSTTVAYSQLSDIDWTHGTCEIVVLALPEFRFGFGLLALLKTYDFAFGTLNLRSVLNDVNDGNRMMSSREVLLGKAQVIMPNAHFTEGRVRDSFQWTETRAEIAARFGFELPGQEAVAL